MLELCESRDTQVERLEQEAYQRLCQAKTKNAKTKAMNEMYRLMAQRSWQRVERMEQARQARQERIRRGG